MGYMSANGIIYSENTTKSGGLGTMQDPRPPILEPRWPTWPQDPPCWSQDGPKVPDPGAKMAPRPPILELHWEIPPIVFFSQGQHNMQVIASKTMSTQKHDNSNAIAIQ